jgi:hypothetical protein
MIEKELYKIACYASSIRQYNPITSANSAAQRQFARLPEHSHPTASLIYPPPQHHPIRNLIFINHRSKLITEMLSTRPLEASGEKLLFLDRAIIRCLA